MKQTFLSEGESNQKLILLFAGWASDEKLYEHICVDGWDVMLCSDYDDFGFDRSLLDGYHTIYVYAWSLGVFVAERVLQGVNITFSVAVNGTPTPVSDSEGIPEAVYFGTLHGLNERNLMKFRMRMFDSVSDYKAVSDRFTADSDIGVLKCQLERVAEEVKELRIKRKLRALRIKDKKEIKEVKDFNDKTLRTPPSVGVSECIAYRSVCIVSGLSGFVWSKVIVGVTDRIFPVENQRRAWRNHPCVQELKRPHYVDMAEVVKSTIVESGQVAARFCRSQSTYDDNAIAQRRIALNLAELIVESVECREEIAERRLRLLEIGCGTGLLTRAYGDRVSPTSAVFVDLCDMPRFGVARDEQYVVADAEKWLESLSSDEKFDWIVSSSTIQWFGNINRFFGNCKKHLNEGGVVCMSTFAPHNLQELDSVRISPVKYYSVDSLKNILTKYFAELYVKEETVELQFDSPIEALRNLRLTGVTASGHSKDTVELKKLMQNFPKNDEGKCILTYRPIYIVAKHKN